jgi:hypothetical protein
LMMTTQGDASGETAKLIVDALLRGESPNSVIVKTKTAAAANTVSTDSKKQPVKPSAIHAEEVSKEAAAKKEDLQTEAPAPQLPPMLAAQQAQFERAEQVQSGAVDAVPRSDSAEDAHFDAQLAAHAPPLQQQQQQQQQEHLERADAVAAAVADAINSSADTVNSGAAASERRLVAAKSSADTGTC